MAMETPICHPRISWTPCEDFWSWQLMKSSMADPINPFLLLNGLVWHRIHSSCVPLGCIQYYKGHAFRMTRPCYPPHFWWLNLIHWVDAIRKEVFQVLWAEIWLKQLTILASVSGVLLNDHSHQIRAAEDLTYLLLGWVKPSTYIYALSSSGLEGFCHVSY